MESQLILHLLYRDMINLETIKTKASPTKHRVKFIDLILIFMYNCIM